MRALFFEVRPKQGQLKYYFEHVDVLKPVLAQHKGLVFLGRYPPGRLTRTYPHLLSQHSIVGQPFGDQRALWQRCDLGCNPRLLSPRIVHH